MDARAVAASELLTEKSLLDKVLEKVVEKTDKAEKTNDADRGQWYY